MVIDRSRMQFGLGWCLVVLAAWISASNGVNVSEFEKIGNGPNTTDRFVLYVNGSIYGILKDTNVTQEFDVATRQWMPNRKYKPITRDGFIDDYFALGNRPFAMLVPDNFTADSGPFFFFWDEEAGEFQSLPVTVDSSAMPNSTSEIWWAIGVADKSGSDAYFAMVNRGTPTSDAAFSKLHIEFNGSLPIKGELKGFHRASLPAYNTIAYLVPRNKTIYWFLKTRTLVKMAAILDTDHAYYYNLATNASGNISTTSDGVMMFPLSESNLIGSNHILVAGRIYTKPNTSESDWTVEYWPFVWWVFQFGPDQWTPIMDNFPVGGHSVDTVNSKLYVVSNAVSEVGGVQEVPIYEKDAVEFKPPSFISANMTVDRTARRDGFVYNNDKLYYVTVAGNMSIFNPDTKQWTLKNFTPIAKARGYTYSYFSMKSTVFLAVVTSKVIGGNWTLTLDVYSWNETSGQFEKAATYQTTSSKFVPSDNIYMATTVAASNGSIAYLALTGATEKASEVVIVRMAMQFSANSSMNANFSEIRRLPLKGLDCINVGAMAVNNRRLYMFCRGYTAGIKYWLDFHMTRFIDLETIGNLPPFIERPSVDGQADIVDMWDVAMSIKKQIFMIGRQTFLNGTTDVRLWSFNTDDERWTMEAFRLPYNDYYDMFAYDRARLRLYVRPWYTDGFYVSRVEKRALDISKVEKIGDSPPAINSTVVANTLRVIYVNGSLYYIQRPSNVMMEFNVATKQWARNRNYKPFKRDGSMDDYFALGNRVFAISIANNSTGAPSLSFFFWDKGTNQFRSLLVDIDSSSLPSSGSDTWWAIGVPDKSGSDAYFAVINKGSPTSEAAFSKLHVEFNGTFPSKGEMRGFHRASLPANNTVQHLVLNKDVLYWFLQTPSPTSNNTILDTKHGYYYILTSNVAGEMSTSTSDGSDMYQQGVSYLIDDNHLFAIGGFYNKPNTPELEPSDKNVKALPWFYEFASRRWTPVNSTFSGDFAFRIDVDNGTVYAIMEDGSVRTAKITV